MIWSALAHYRLAEVTQFAHDVGVGVDRHLGIRRTVRHQLQGHIRADRAIDPLVGSLDVHARPPRVAVALRQHNPTFQAHYDWADFDFECAGVGVRVVLADGFDSRYTGAHRRDIHHEVPDFVGRR